MLLAVGGAQGSGKSTTLRRLTEQYGIKCVERKTSRSILADWGVTLSEVNNVPELTMRFQDEILERKYQDEVQFEDSDEWVASERSFYDLIAYSVVALGKDNKYSDWLDDYVNRCLSHQRIYEKLFYIKSGMFGVVNDGVRSINQHYSKLVDSYMLTLYKDDTHLATEFINTISLDARVEQIRNSLVI